MNTSDFIFGRIASSGAYSQLTADGGCRLRLLAVLAWAARREIPFQDALPVLLDEFGSRFKKRIRAAIDDLADGELLAIVLRNRLAGYLPPYCLAAIEKAEAEGCLGEVLPQMEQDARFGDGARKHIQASLLYPFTILIIIFLFMATLFSAVIPQLLMIFHEYQGEAYSGPLIILAEFVDVGFESFAWGVFIILAALIFLPLFILSIIGQHVDLFIEHPLVAVVLGLMQILFLLVLPVLYYRAFCWFCRNLYRGVSRYFEWFLVHLPILGTQIRKMALLETAGAMAALTGAGYDVAQAAYWNAPAVSSRWIGRKLKAFADSVASGQPWGEAWERMGVGSPTHNWLIHNAAGRENPAEGFAMLADWLDQEVRYSVDIGTKLLEAFCILLNAALVGFVVYAGFHALSQLIYTVLS